MTNHLVLGAITPGDNAGTVNGGLFITGNLALDNGTNFGAASLKVTGATLNDSGITNALGLGGTAYTDYVTANAANWNDRGQNAFGNHDWLSINGSLTINTGSTLTVADNGYLANAQTGDVFDLIDWVGAFNGTFNVGTNFRAGGAGGGDLVLPTLNGGLAYDVSQFTTYGVVIVVPEPGRAMLLLVGLASLVLRRRRSKVA